MTFTGHWPAGWRGLRRLHYPARRPSVMPWFMNRGFEVVSEGFVPAGATPLEDFVAKFTGVRYVVDPGSKRERNYAYANVGDLWIGSFYGFPLCNPLTRRTKAAAGR
jgi:hypothetical protein